MNKGQIKKFLSPDKSKLILLAVFALVNVALIYTDNRVAPAVVPDGGSIHYHGVPLPFYVKVSECNSFPSESEQLKSCLETSKLVLHSDSLILDIILGYLISCLIVLAYSKIRHKK